VSRSGRWVFTSGGEEARRNSRFASRSMTASYWLWDTAAAATSGIYPRSLSVSETKSLTDLIEGYRHALMAEELALARHLPRVDRSLS
jgi:hypothetical protein